MGGVVAVVNLRSPLRDLAGGSGTLEVEGATVSELLDRLEQDYPRLAGWMRDEGGSLREHVTVFVNGERPALVAHPPGQARVVLLQPVQELRDGGPLHLEGAAASGQVTKRRAKVHHGHDSSHANRSEA